MLMNQRCVSIQPLVTREVLVPDLVQALPERLEFVPAHRPFLAGARAALGVEAHLHGGCVGGRRRAILGK